MPGNVGILPVLCGPMAARDNFNALSAKLLKIVEQSVELRCRVHIAARMSQDSSSASL